MDEIRIAIVGFGKIAQDQHVPAIGNNPAFRLVAVVSPRGSESPAVPLFTDHQEMLRVTNPHAVAICTPPGPRHRIARDCLEYGAHVLLEKPPCATVGEIADLAELGRRGQTTLFTAWHAQFNEAVSRAAGLIAQEGLGSLRIEWLENVDKWHPGQQWIWQPGGFGVFDAGINALSIVTLLCPEPLLLRSAEFILPRDRQQPIAATLDMHSPGARGDITARLDWRQRVGELWSIEAVTSSGTHLHLLDGGKSLQVGGQPRIKGDDAEYAAIYAEFERLVREHRSRVDAEPLRLTADAFLIAKRITASEGAGPFPQP